MCPACITTMALVAASAASTGGLTALIARTLHRKHAAEPVAAETNAESLDGSTVARQVHHQGEGK